MSAVSGRFAQGGHMDRKIYCGRGCASAWLGDALYRHAKQAAEVYTVPFGSFRRTLIEQVGFFDESLLRIKIMSSTRE